MFGQIWKLGLLSHRFLTGKSLKLSVHISLKALFDVQDSRGEVAKNYSIPGLKGTVSFIASMTSAFFGECDRYKVLRM